ncbi:MAG TPA: histidine kinase [Streptosporangiaceae bacterium]|nr:histidine kinase [Streptosporangiaceae bacterium]
MKRLMARATALPPRVQDLALALALTIVSVGGLVPYRSQLHPFGLAIALVAAQNIPLTWRRSWPVPVLLAAGLPRITYDLLGFGFAPLPLATSIAFFTCMERCRPATRRVVLILVVIGTTISQLAPGHNQPYDVTVSVLINLTAWLAAVLSRTRQAYIQEVEDRVTRAEAERDDGAARAAAAERTRIARELHDVVAHHVSLMAVQAEAATSLLPGRPAEAAQSVDVIATTARQALTELRRLLGVLRGPAEHLETSPSVSLAELGSVIDQVRNAGLPVELTVRGTPCPLAPGIDLTAYRIIQEALTNTVRHARAAQAAVTLCYEPGYVTVSVTDCRPDTVPGPGANGAAGDGVVRDGAAGGGVAGIGVAGDGVAGDGAAGDGAAADGAGRIRSGGFGLAGIAERVASCGGNLTVGPTGGGYAVTARLPVR